MTGLLYQKSNETVTIATNLLTNNLEKNSYLSQNFDSKQLCAKLECQDMSYLKSYHYEPTILLNVFNTIISAAIFRFFSYKVIENIDPSAGDGIPGAMTLIGIGILHCLPFGIAYSYGRESLYTREEIIAPYKAASIKIDDVNWVLIGKNSANLPDLKILEQNYRLLDNNHQLVADFVTVEKLQSDRTHSVKILGAEQTRAVCYPDLYLQTLQVNYNDDGFYTKTVNEEHLHEYSYINSTNSLMQLNGRCFDTDDQGYAYTV